MAKTKDGDVLFVLHELAHLIRTRFDQRARRHGMTRAQWVILVKLQRQAGLSQKELAQAVEVEPMTVARLVDRLEASGFVERRADPADRRVWRLFLLPAAEPILKEIDAVRAEMLATISGDISPDEVAGATGILSRMKANLLAAD